MSASRHLTVRAVAFLSLTLVPLAGAPAANPKASDLRSPAELVQAALKTELDGPSEARAGLLKQAIELDPEFAPARWQLGFVRFDDQWLTLDEVAERVADDKRLIEYRKRRDALVDTADNQRELARWCHKQHLADEARIHWAKVLEFEPQDAEALAALGLQLYEGRLLTKVQIDAAKKQAAAVRLATKQWQPRLLKWRKAIEGGSSKDRLAALQELQKLSDPNVIPALEATFAEERASKTGDERNRLLIGTVGRLPFPEATQVLLRRAILPDSEEIRNAAADELKKRPMHAYVPQLIAALPGSIKTKFHVYVLPGGMVLHEHEVVIEGRQADVSFTYSSVVNPGDAASAMVITPRALNGELQNAAATEAVAKETNERLDWLKTRVKSALERTTGFANSDDPALSERQYYDYYNWAKPRVTKPEYKYTFENAEGYSRVPIQVSQTRTGVYNDPTVPRPRFISCFPAGTPVLTANGLQPIESVKLGDRVLTQDVVSGELQCKPVQATTLVASTPMVRIGIGTVSIVAPLGHPFWVNGEGWRMAKHLNIGQTLHGLEGALIIDSIEEAPASEAYNLIVSDAGTYFVGDTPILVHDNTPLVETAARVPGLAAEALSP